MTKRNKVLLGAAVAGILGATMSSVPALAASKKDVYCAGVNACKGKGMCQGGGHECGGQNGCKGQGVVKVSKDACDALGGTVAAPQPAKPK
jgi:hypothetical protein